MQRATGFVRGLPLRFRNCTGHDDDDEDEGAVLQPLRVWSHWPPRVRRDEMKRDGINRKGTYTMKKTKESNAIFGIFSFSFSCFTGGLPINLIVDTPRVKKRVSERVLQKVVHIIRSKTMGRRLASAKSLAKSLADSFTKSLAETLGVTFGETLVAKLCALAKRLPTVSDRIICMPRCKTLSETRFFTRGLEGLLFKEVLFRIKTHEKVLEINLNHKPKNRSINN